MRKFAMTIAVAAAIVGAGSLLPNQASAMTVPAPAGLAAAAGEVNLAESVAYVCRRVWNGYSWRRVCHYTRGGYGYHRPYRHHRPYRSYRY
jgi:hypothetical protein